MQNTTCSHYQILDFASGDLDVYGTGSHVITVKGYYFRAVTTEEPLQVISILRMNGAKTLPFSEISVYIFVKIIPEEKIIFIYEKKHQLPTSDISVKRNHCLRQSKGIQSKRPYKFKVTISLRKPTVLTL